MAGSPRVHPIACKRENRLESAFGGGVEGLYFFYIFSTLLEIEKGWRTNSEGGHEKAPGRRGPRAQC
jgi:hypothetical protein